MDASYPTEIDCCEMKINAVPNGVQNTNFLINSVKNVTSIITKKCGDDDISG